MLYKIGVWYYLNLSKEKYCDGNGIIIRKNCASTCGYTIN